MKKQHIVYIFRISRLPPVTFFATTFFQEKVFLMILCNICNRYLSGLILTGLEIYKEHFCIGKVVAKKWWKPWNMKVCFKMGFVYTMKIIIALNNKVCFTFEFKITASAFYTLFQLVGSRQIDRSVIFIRLLNSDGVRRG